MAKWGSVDFRELKKLQEKLVRFQKIEQEKFLEKMVKEIAARMLRRVKFRTPVGKYPASSGKVGGTLRRGWTIDPKITRKGANYEIEIFNPVNYASYVEYGHRTRNHAGWVTGQFFMTIAAAEVESLTPRILEKRIMQHLGEVFDGE
ncbi:MAG: HK97 gp10 family phage protein [Alkaliphilus sp.]